MDIATAAVFENEIVKHEDFQFGFESVIRNTAALDRMLVSADTDYIIGGDVLPAAGALGVRIGRLWGNGPALDLPVFSNAVSEAIPLTAPVNDTRIDTVQVQAAFLEYDIQRRAFHEAELGAGSYSDTPTKKRLIVKAEIKQGVEGQLVAPTADAGWLKLAEIEVEVGATTLPASAIHGVMAQAQGVENAAWTAEKTRTFNLGSTLDLKSGFTKEHTNAGEHRPHVIHAETIDFGIGHGQVNSQSMPLGKDYKIGTDEFKATESLYASLVREIIYRRAADAENSKYIAANTESIKKNADDIAANAKAIAGQVSEAPKDGRLYGRRDSRWDEIPGVSEFHKLYTVFSDSSLTVTNADVVARRKRGWDIGIPYLSLASRVYHFDTDCKDQHQKSGIIITGSASLVGETSAAGAVCLKPAVAGIPPYEMAGKSLYGHFSVKDIFLLIREWSVEFWARVFNLDSASVVKIVMPVESIELRTPTALYPAYSAAGADGVGWGVAESDGIAWGAGGNTATGIVWGTPAADGIAWGEAGPDGVSFSTPSVNGREVVHRWCSGEERAALAEYTAGWRAQDWNHIALVASASEIALYFNESRIAFQRRDLSPTPVILMINSDGNEFNLDELMIDAGKALDFDAFRRNTKERIPYGNIPLGSKALVLEAGDLNTTYTNLFDTDLFKRKVIETIKNQKENA